MLTLSAPSGPSSSALTVLRLIHHNTARTVRRAHGNAVMAIVINALQTIIMVAVFYLMLSLLGLRGRAIRGDFLLYIMTGVFLFMTHVRTVGAVFKSEGPASPMMQHLPMTTAIAIASAALGTLYIQLVSLFAVLGIYALVWGPIEIAQPVPALLMVLLSWYSGVAIGLLFLAFKPWTPGLTGILSTLFQRANMFASGKMFVANSLPGFMLPLFWWNPLFHEIDQARGFVFINYNPHFTSVGYPLAVSTACLCIGLMAEFYTRKHASASWNARR